MAGGRALFGKQQNNQQALLLISSDKGKSWNVSNAGVVNLMRKSGGQIDSIVKSGHNWMASGFYWYSIFPSPVPNQSQLFFTSQDNGLTWKEINLESTRVVPPARGLLLDFKCINSVCLQVGTGNGHPIIARSEDSGDTWNVIKNIAGGDDSIFDKLTCYRDFCVAADENLIFSHDKGQSWAQSSKINNTPNDFKYGGIKQVSCYNDTMCAAVGWWTNKNGAFFPMIINTRDGGETWIYQNNPFITAINEFNAIQCSESMCEIIGTRDRSFLILTSQDGGLTWTSQNEIIGLPSSIESGLISFLNKEEIY